MCSSLVHRSLAEIQVACTIFNPIQTDTLVLNKHMYVYRRCVSFAGFLRVLWAFHAKNLREVGRAARGSSLRRT